MSVEETVATRHGEVRVAGFYGGELKLWIHRGQQGDDGPIEINGVPYVASYYLRNREKTERCPTGWWIEHLSLHRPGWTKDPTPGARKAMREIADDVAAWANDDERRPFWAAVMLEAAEIAYDSLTREIKKLEEELENAKREHRHQYREVEAAAKELKALGGWRP